MKKSLFVWAAGLMALAACSNNDDLLNHETPDGKVIVTATLPSDAPDSRVALTEDNTNAGAPTIKVAWEETESFSVIRGTENVTYSKTTEGNTFTGDVHTTTDGTYYGFYPTTTATTISALPYDFSAQTGALDATKTYMYAVNATDGKNYEFKHLTALVKFTLSLPDNVSGVTPSKVVINSDKLIPVGTVDLTSDAVSYAKTGNTGTSITITPSGGTVSLSFYAYVNPMGASNTFVISMDGNDGNYYSGALETSVAIQAGYLYAASVDMIKVEKGDYAMKDGSFMKYEEGETLTDEQKANVRGIVFWTTAETTMEGRTTPAKLTDDVIMAADFPNCTHGLIVSLKDVSTSCPWQSTYDKVASWQDSDSFAAENKDKYKSIASVFGATDPINYILGYQNTKLLKAYNAQCADANKVLPVSSLDEFSEGNPAPAHTTGWFIPSVKELHMLCYKDVDNVWDTYGTDKVDTKNVINTSLNAVAGDSFGGIYNYYWSSTERTEKDYAFGVRFYNANVNSNNKEDSTDYVRAVCAF